ncbi:co-chaperone YbbN [Desulfovibrio sp. DV]|uniref:thioredoxin family protein n=1 Tax=Desulfovibrio sp. DV TaxID=1844708 RepID=UPI00094B9928|nr:thioredoxin family protein [Desulfovibrio sp. DV]
MKHVAMCFALATVLSAGICFAAEPVPEVPVKGMVTVVDLGAKTCIPCKMMVPVLDAMEKQYQGKASVVFIDVRENPAQAPKFGIKTIPTQIFYDKNGKETYRHEGYLDQKPFAEMIDKLLAD